MRRSFKIKAVYHELRQSLGDIISPKQALEFADDLVGLYAEEITDVQVDFRTGGVKFFEREVDSVMADGGWNLLSKTEPDIWQQEETERYEFNQPGTVQGSAINF